MWTVWVDTDAPNNKKLEKQHSKGRIDGQRVKKPPKTSYLRNVPFKKTNKCKSFFVNNTKYTLRCFWTVIPYLVPAFNTLISVVRELFAGNKSSGALQNLEISLLINYSTLTQHQRGTPATLQTLKDVVIWGLRLERERERERTWQRKWENRNEEQRTKEVPLFSLMLVIAAHFVISADIVSEILEKPLGMGDG